MADTTVSFSIKVEITDQTGKPLFSAEHFYAEIPYRLAVDVNGSLMPAMQKLYEYGRSAVEKK